MKKRNKWHKHTKVNMMINFKAKIWCLLILTISLASCIREEATTWNINAAGPIAHGRLSLGDMVADSLLSLAETGLWHLIISENLTDLNLDSIVSIPDTTIKQSLLVPLIGGPFSIPPNSSIIGIDEENSLNVSQASLKEVHVKGGMLEYTVRNYINGYLTCTYELPGVTKNGEMAVLVANTEPGSSSNPDISFGVLDLSGYEMDLTGESGNEINTLLSHIIVKTSADAPVNAEIFGMDSVSIELKIVDPQISYARGYFGQHQYSLDQTVDFGDALNLPQGILNLSEISVDFEVENFVGADAQIQFNQLLAVNTYSALSNSLNSPDLLSQINVTRATQIGDQIFPTYQHIAISESNSNVDVFIETLPNQVQIDADITINPLGNISDNNDFIYTDKTLNAWMNIDVPLCIGMSGLALSREIELTGDSIDLVANGELFLHLTNGFPFSAEINLVLRNEDSEWISNLIDSTTMTTGLTTDGFLVLPQTSVFTIPVTQFVIDNLNAPNRLFLEITFDTPEAVEFIKLTEDNFIDFVLTTRAGTQISIQ